MRLILYIFNFSPINSPMERAVFGDKRIKRMRIVEKESVSVMRRNNYSSASCVYAGLLF